MKSINDYYREPTYRDDCVCSAVVNGKKIEEPCLKLVNILRGQTSTTRVRNYTVQCGSSITFNDFATRSPEEMMAIIFRCLDCRGVDYTDDGRGGIYGNKTSESCQNQLKRRG